MNNFVVTLIGGLAGGLFWLVAQASAGSIALLTTWTFLYAVMGGPIAAGIGVFLLTDRPADDSKSLQPNQLSRTLFYACVCGIAFPSIIDSTVAANQSKIVAAQENANSTVTDNANQVSLQARSGNADIDEMKTRVRDLINSLSDPNLSATAKEGAQQRIQETISLLSQRAAAEPQRASAYTELIAQLSQAGSTSPQKAAIENLGALANDSNPRVSAPAKAQLDGVLSNVLPREAVQPTAEAIAAPDASAPAQR